MIIIELLVIGNILSLGVNGYLIHRNIKQLNHIQFQLENDQKREEVKLELLKQEYEKRLNHSPQIYEATVLS